jgi:hypothetical protein
MNQCNILVIFRQDDPPDRIGLLLSKFEKHFGSACLILGADGAGPPETGGDPTPLDAQTASCDVLVILIGPSWLTARDSIGECRLNNPHDLVRQQIKSALLAGVRIIPVLLDDAEMPRAGTLPTDLKRFARRKPFRCQQEHWEGDCSLVVSKIENALREAEFKKQRNLKKQKIEALAPLEASAWEKVSVWATHSKSDIEALKKFLDEFPDGAHSSQARKLLTSLLEKAATVKSDRWHGMRQEPSRRALFLAGAAVALSLAGVLGWLYESRWRELRRTQRR